MTSQCGEWSHHADQRWDHLWGFAYVSMTGPRTNDRRLTGATAASALPAQTKVLTRRYVEGRRAVYITCHDTRHRATWRI